MCFFVANFYGIKSHRNWSRNSNNCHPRRWTHWRWQNCHQHRNLLRLDWQSENGNLQTTVRSTSKKVSLLFLHRIICAVVFMQTSWNTRSGQITKSHFLVGWPGCAGAYNPAYICQRLLFSFLLLPFQATPSPFLILQNRRLGQLLAWNKMMMIRGTSATSHPVQPAHVAPVATCQNGKLSNILSCHLTTEWSNH